MRPAVTICSMESSARARTYVRADHLIHSKRLDSCTMYIPSSLQHTRRGCWMHVFCAVQAHEWPAHQQLMRRWGTVHCHILLINLCRTQALDLQNLSMGCGGWSVPRRQAALTDRARPGWSFPHSARNRCDFLPFAPPPPAPTRSRNQTNVDRYQLGHTHQRP